MIDITSNEALKQEYERQRAESRDNQQKANILVAGGTGSGKSSLVNLVFGNDTAEVGAGQPVTRGIHRFEHDSFVLFDSEGYESGEESQANYRKNILVVLEDGRRSGRDAIHLVWYCITLAGHRILNIDIETVNAIKAKNIPVCVVMTQADSVDEEDSETMRQTVHRECVGVPIFESSTDPTVGLSTDPLIDWSAKNLDEGIRSAFLSGVRGGIPAKEAEGLRIIVTHTLSAAGIAASPIPMSDAPLLVANQVAMIARLTRLWEIKGAKAALQSAVVGQALSIAGRSLAGNALKLIPGVGSTGGAAINATVASTLTGAVGYAINEICARIYSDTLNGTVREIASYFDAGVVSELVKGYLSAKESVSV